MPVRLLSFALLFATALPVSAQTTSAAPQPTVEGYLCTFAGKCGGADAPVVTRTAPQTKGFRIARPVSETKAALAGTAIAPARLARMPAAASHGRTARPAYTGSAVRSFVPVAAAPAYAAGARPRADLMIGFELNSDRLSAQGMNAAQTFARSLQMPELAGKRFLIEGHTDLRGGQALNASLSARRAQAVTNYLVSQGVDRSRLQARGFGSSRPLPGHAVTDSVNRRVEAELLS